ncbi:hypothetical protein [Clostridium perfringens]|uniref:hypothetical protein n=1 Tax=Clostridium perfringens TaxID=1502 RepID=UPI0024BC0EE1|nr:hypothetical protein [Clostridium perfringens]
MNNLELKDLENINGGNAIVGFFGAYVAGKVVDAYGKYVLGVGMTSNGENPGYNKKSARGRGRGYN